MRSLASIGFPSIGAQVGTIPAPDRVVAGDPAVLAARTRLVRVTGTACGFGVEGSGWIAADGEVVTAAHVVAGESDTSVQLGGAGPLLAAQVIWFDAHNDVAVLSVPGMRGIPSLPLAANERAGTSGAILGFPEDGSLHVGPARLGATRALLTDDAYGRGPILRQVALRGDLRPGNSGGPMVDGHGRVLTTVFARATGAPHGGFGVPDALVAHALSAAQGPVGTGSCTG